jgi:hypothetical protein
MFRKLADTLPAYVAPSEFTQADTVFSFHPEQLSRWLDEIWARGGIANWAPLFPDTPTPLGDAAAVARSSIPPELLSPSGVDEVAAKGLPPGYHLPPVGVVRGPLLWDHMFYAYLVECTGAFEIFSEVVRRYVVGETLPSPSIGTTTWVRATEELFFRDPPLYRVGGLTSQLRPDAQVNRRNAYWRMFGLDLPHAARGLEGQPWKRDTGATANARFLELWNELLRQVWLGIENERNSSGSNPTDSNYVGYLCQTIGEMLRLRRRGGMLAREEFGYVCMLNWFHLTVDSENALVRNLSANAGTTGGNAADRLAAIGERVGVTPSRQARELFELARVISPLMWGIELRRFDLGPQAELLYRSTGILNPAPAQTMNRIIDLWQSATGERVKDLAVTMRRSPAQARSAQPTKLLPGGLPPQSVVSSSNGHVPATTRS